MCLNFKFASEQEIRCFQACAYWYLDQKGTVPHYYKKRKMCQNGILKSLFEYKERHRPPLFQTLTN